MSKAGTLGPIVTEGVPPLKGTPLDRLPREVQPRRPVAHRPEDVRRERAVGEGAEPCRGRHRVRRRAGRRGREADCGQPDPGAGGAGRAVRELPGPGGAVGGPGPRDRREPPRAGRAVRPAAAPRRPAPGAHPGRVPVDPQGRRGRGDARVRQPHRPRRAQEEGQPPHPGAQLRRHRPRRGPRAGRGPGEGADRREPGAGDRVRPGGRAGRGGGGGAGVLRDRDDAAQGRGRRGRGEGGRVRQLRPVREVGQAGRDRGPAAEPPRAGRAAGVRPAC